MPAAVCGENGTPGPGVTNGKGNGLGLAAAGAAGGFKERLSPRVEGGTVPNSSNEERADGFWVVVAARAGVPGSTFVDMSICDGLDDRSEPSESDPSAE